MGFACTYYSLPALEESWHSVKSHFCPSVLRILLESLLRNYDGHQITEEGHREFGKLGTRVSPKALEIPFKTGTRGRTRFHGCFPSLSTLPPCVSAVAELGGDAGMIENRSSPVDFGH